MSDSSQESQSHPMSSQETSLVGTLWSALGGDAALLGALHFCGPAGGLPSRFHVSDLAVATIGVATLAAAELWSARRKEALRSVTIDRRLAAAAFQCERLLQPVGWTRPPPWRSEEHTSELQSRPHLVCRLLLEKKKKQQYNLHQQKKKKQHIQKKS